MSIGLIGKKVGMTRVFTEEGKSVAVTVIDVSDNIFLQRKTAETDGYSGVQVAFDEQKDFRLNKATMGHIEAHGGSAKKRVVEFRLENDEQVPVDLDHPGIDLFEEGQWVDVIGKTKGKGFQGVVKRWGFSGQPQSHGHMMHRRPGGIGAGTDPGRIWKNKKMPGRHGNYNRTVQNLQVVQKRPDDNVLLISGAVPGAKGGYVVIRPAIKKGAVEQDLKTMLEAKAAREKEKAPKEEEQVVEAAEEKVEDAEAATTDAPAAAEGEEKSEE